MFYRGKLICGHMKTFTMVGTLSEEKLRHNYCLSCDICSGWKDLAREPIHKVMCKDCGICQSDGKECYNYSSPPNGERVRRELDENSEACANFRIYRVNCIFSELGFGCKIGKICDVASCKKWQAAPQKYNILEGEITVTSEFRKIALIKDVREVFGFGLKEAKDAVEAWIGQYNTDPFHKFMLRRVVTHTDDMIAGINQYVPEYKADLEYAVVRLERELKEAKEKLANS